MGKTWGQQLINMATNSRYSDSLGLADAAQTMSPAHSRLQELSHRMTAVHDDFDAEKKARSSVMELKCRAIDEKIMRNKRSEDERLKPVYILIERLGLDIGSERARRRVQMMRARTLKVELSKATHSLELEKQMVSQLQEQLFTGIKDSVATAQKESLKAEHAKAAQQMAEKKIRNVDQMASAVKQEKDQAMGVILLQKREIEEGRVQTKAVEAELYQVHNQCSVMEKTERDIFNAVIASHAALLELGATIEERDAKSGYPSDPSVVGCIKSDTEYMQQLARQLEVKQRTDRLSHIGQETNDNLPQSPNQSQSPSPGQNLLANNPADAFFISQNPFESSASNPFLSQSGVELGGVPSPVQKREPRALSRNRATPANRAKTNHGPRKIGGIPRDVLRGMGSPLKSKTALLEDNMSPHSRANALPPLALVNPSLI